MALPSPGWSPMRQTGSDGSVIPAEKGRTLPMPADIASASGQLGPAPERNGLDEDRRRSPTTRSTSAQGSTPRPAHAAGVLSMQHGLLPEERLPERLLA